MSVSGELGWASANASNATGKAGAEDQLDMTDRPAAADGSSRTRPAHLGLSGKLLVLTLPFVMIAEVLIYVPSIANFRLNWLRDRLSAAYTAALVFEAAPEGMVPEHGHPPDPGQHRRPRGGAEDGRAAAPAGGLRHAAGDQPRHRHARHVVAPRHHRRLRHVALRRRRRHAGGGARAHGRRVRRDRAGRGAAAQGDGANSPSAS